MKKLVLPTSLGSELSGVNAEVELCDQEGRTVGFFLPPDLHHELLYSWAKSLLPEDEEDRALAREEYRSSGGLTTAEIIAHLQGLSGSGRKDP